MQSKGTRNARGVIGQNNFLQNPQQNTKPAGLSFNNHSLDY
ncbi:hypothetical protein KUTeg_019960 [Tegillarca granosa]|uniref:Uncharacterized protein n=1 Tax=Tegillarca granosa TaxID=220873 RepID=A0ABQ9EE27_TEGGR|nr:hypothetical protein KUTeg_019960 [Tegillarca granosa]